MTQEAMRFLALNAVLHGYPATDAFEGSAKVMGDALGVDEVEAAKLSETLHSFPLEKPSENALVSTFLNFYRNSHYTFVTMGADPMPLSRFVVSDAEGQVSDELRYMFLSRLIMDVAQDERYIEPSIVDGILRCTPEAFEQVETCMLEAYQLLLSGPVGTVKGLSTALRKFTSLEHYSRLNGPTLLRIFRQMVRAKHNPILYQKTLVNTPDLLGTYQKTGCIMAFTDYSHTRVNWLLDVDGVADSTLVLSADMNTLQLYLQNSVRDLAGVKAARGLGEGGKILFPGVT